METYDIYFKEGNDFANKGFSLKEVKQAIENLRGKLLASRQKLARPLIACFTSFNVVPGGTET